MVARPGRRKPDRPLAILHRVDDETGTVRRGRYAYFPHRPAPAGPLCFAEPGAHLSHHRQFEACQAARAESDPFAMEWLRTNPAGGGAFKIESFRMGERILFSRFDEWKSGKLPGFKRVLWQTVPAAESRVASLLKGDADIAQDLPPKDAVELSKNPEVKVLGVPMAGNFQFIGMNSQLKPFDNVKVRQAIAYVLPYDKMFEARFYGRGRPLFGRQARRSGDHRVPAAARLQHGPGESEEQYVLSRKV